VIFFYKTTLIILFHVRLFSKKLLNDMLHLLIFPNYPIK